MQHLLNTVQQETIKNVLNKVLKKVTLNHAHQIWSLYVVFIKHSPGDNRLKILKNSS